MTVSVDQVPELVPLRKMASQARVPAKWLREKAESGEVPALRAGDRFLFLPALVKARLAEMAKGGE